MADAYDDFLRSGEQGMYFVNCREALDYSRYDLETALRLKRLAEMQTADRLAEASK